MKGQCLKYWALLSFALSPIPLLAIEPQPANTTAEEFETKFNFEAKPVWEVGFGAGYFSGKDYPGSNDPNIAQFALPFFIYRSKIFRIGGGGVGAVAVEEPRLKLDVSFGGSLNAESEPDSVRAGLPDLDLLFEFGPRLQYTLFDLPSTSGSNSRLNWDSKIRAVAKTDFKGISTQGFVIGTGLGYTKRGIATDKIDLIFNADITFGDQRYNDYLYTVSVEYATPQRAQYTAKAGYVESRIFLGLAFKPLGTLRIFTGVAAFSHANSANEKSPLFESTNSVQYAVGVVWTAYKSKKTINVYESN